MDEQWRQWDLGGHEGLRQGTPGRACYIPTMRTATALIAVVCLGSSGKGPSEQERLANRTARIEKAQTAISKPLAHRVQQVGKNELLTVEIPSADHLGYIDTQRCYVWRDLEMRTASLSCPHPPELAAPQ